MLFLSCSTRTVSPDRIKKVNREALTIRLCEYTYFSGQPREEPAGSVRSHECDSDDLCEGSELIGDGPRTLTCSHRKKSRFPG